MESRLTFFLMDESHYHVYRGGLYREGVYSKMLFMNSMFTGSQCSYYYYFLLSHEGTVVSYIAGDLVANKYRMFR